MSDYQPSSTGQPAWDRPIEGAGSKQEPSRTLGFSEVMRVVGVHDQDASVALGTIEARARSWWGGVGAGTCRVEIGWSKGGTSVMSLMSHVITWEWWIVCQVKRVDWRKKENRPRAGQAWTSAPVPKCFAQTVPNWARSKLQQRIQTVQTHGVIICIGKRFRGRTTLSTSALHICSHPVS